MKEMKIELNDLVEQLFMNVKQKIMIMNKAVIAVNNISVQDDGETNTIFADIIYMKDGVKETGQIAMYL